MKEESQDIDQQIEELEKLIFDNPDLENLDSIINQFNIFSSLGIINQEIRHSNFLAWLLDPSETHNLSDYFVNIFLKLALKSQEKGEIDLTIFDIDAFDLSEIKVFKEWRNIDILLVDDLNQFVCVIENKIDSSEHSQQLTRYKKEVNQQYKDYKKIFIYLTVHGEAAELEEVFIPIRHSDIASLIENLLSRRESQMNDDVVLFITHYLEMLKRYIMEESDVQVLCENIYKKHQKALDLIYKHRPDIYSDIQQMLEELIDETPGLIKDHCTKSAIRFIPEEMDFFPQGGKEWTKTKRFLLFEIQNYNGKVNLYLIIGPTDSHGEIREQIFELVKDKSHFNNAFKKLGAKWSTIHRHEIAKVPAISKLKSRDLQKEFLKKPFIDFIKNTMPLFISDFKEIEQSVKEVDF